MENFPKDSYFGKFKLYKKNLKAKPFFLNFKTFSITRQIQIIRIVNLGAYQAKTQKENYIRELLTNS